MLQGIAKDRLLLSTSADPVTGTNQVRKLHAHGRVHLTSKGFSALS